MPVPAAAETCDVVIVYTESRAGIVRGLAAFRFDTEALAEVPANSPRAVNREYQEKLVNMTIFHFARKLFLPAPLRMAYTLVRSVPYVFHGLRCLWRRKLEVEVLDALSIGVSMLRGDFSTAGSVMFLLRLGELLEEWTRKKSLGDLARCMSLNVDRVWQQTAEGEVLVPISQVCAGDAIVVHTGSVIPLDGRVLDGEASVNQASLTGEAEPVRKSEGAVVYAGTVVEEGQITVTVEQQAGNGRYDQIVKMIENSEKLKSASETRAAALADKLVPYSLLGTAVTYALTRNATRAISILMVDFSCALKLSMPLAVLSAMRDCGSYHITVKGGKYLEALANAEPVMQQLLTYRFPEGSGNLTGQSFGNLILAALNGISDSFDQAVARMSEVLAISGRVLPVTNENVALEATFENGTRVLGESKISAFKKEQDCRIESVRLLPEHPKALPEAVRAIGEAELILLGPGSLYTSVIPNLLVDGIADAVRTSDALKIYICNIMTQDGETEGMTASDHVKALLDHSGPGLVDPRSVRANARR